MNKMIRCYVDNETSLPFISIVIPIFNPSMTLLKRCIDSIKMQEYPNIEVILIDDGSEKQYKTKVRALARTHNELKIIEAAHGGASHARNMGMEEATGEWLVFVDADDELCPGFLAEASQLTNDNIDFICGNAIPVYEKIDFTESKGSGQIWVTTQKEDIYLAAEQMLGYCRRRSFKGPDYKGRGPWAKLYRRSALNGLKFNESLAVAEDELFNYRFIRHTRGISFVDSNWYRYYQYQNSLIHSLDIDTIRASIKALLGDIGSDEEKKIFLARSAFIALEGSTNLLKAKTPLNEVAKMLERVGAHGCFDRQNFTLFHLTPWQRVITFCLGNGWYEISTILIEIKEILKRYSGMKSSILMKRD